MSRNSGCPFNIRDYSVKIKNQVTGEYARVKGLNSMSVDVEADAEDGESSGGADGGADASDEDDLDF